ncbi:hypothetical protein N136_03214 [Leifsonia aquatica ATCC 14665]|uniref:Uncharacterized protein n=1 Tax=Leifsonia aquatica ATCC 14665 TaxID=1358026 RepID=U2SZ10_LEIAQ|nr:hypothetical protein N136_03214 [Leifsonia aquatica ATCC 14665]
MPVIRLLGQGNCSRCIGLVGATKSAMNAITSPASASSMLDESSAARRCSSART